MPPTPDTVAALIGESLTDCGLDHWFGCLSLGAQFERLLDQVFWSVPR